MTDVRTMLRSERASRRITHPHLSYSTAGTLICMVCHVQIKTEALWNKHMQSTQHASNAQKTRTEPAARATAPTTRLEESTEVKSSKKRKADDESSGEDSRKRTKGSQLADPTGFTSVPAERNGTLPDDRNGDMKSESQGLASVDTHPSNNSIARHDPSIEQARVSNVAIDEDEWAAFQRDIASPPPEPSALTAAADISAAPMTAAELAAQSRKQASRQAKERIEAEVEGEKEDATRQLEEEFEEMAELEDRVRKLREKREQSRMRKGEGEVAEGIVAVEEETRPPEENGGASDEASSDGDEDEWGTW